MHNPLSATFGALKDAPILVWHCDETGACDWFNDTWLAFTGRSAEQEAGNGWAEGVHPEDRARCVAEFRDALRRRQGFELEYRLRNHSGEYRWIKDIGRPYGGSEGERFGYIGYCFDVTHERQMTLRLHEAQEVAELGYYVYLVAEDSWESSDILDQIFGIGSDYPRNRDSWLALVAPEVRASMAQHLAGVIAREHSFDREYRIIRPADGAERWVHGNGRMDFAEDGRPLRMVGTIRDITQEIRLREALRLNAIVFQNTQQAIIVTDAQRQIVEVNRAFSELTGYAPEEVRGTNPRFLKSGLQDTAFYETMWSTLNRTGRWHGEVWNRRKSGELCPGLLSINAVKNAEDRVSHYVGFFTEISELKTAQQRLEHMANFDALTGLPNRILLADRLQQGLAMARRNNRLLAVCFLDLDEFKPVNDGFGHAVGDALLQEVARRISAAVRSGDTVARIGGDEFVLILNELETRDEANAILERLIGDIAQPCMVLGHQLCITASIGAILCPHPVAQPDELIRLADEAMYQAKRDGRNRWVIASPN
ncbi:MAG TPA: diguanylate cyclase [Rhodocyclaceae bacterium]